MNYFLKILIFFTAMLSVTAIFQRALIVNTPNDPLIELKIVDVAKQKELGTFVAKVSVGMFLKSFPTFDIVKNNFVADALVWFEYDPSKIMLETISQFSFDNGEILKKSQPDIKINDSGKVMVKFDVRISFKSNLSYKKFPVEDHRISLILTNNFVTPAEVYFVVETTDFRYEPTLFIADWKILDVSTDAGFLELGLEDRVAGQVVASPKARFTVNLVKKGVKDTYVIFLPLFLATFVASFSFLVSILNTQTRSIIAASAIPALLGYRFVLQNLLPQIAYFTTTDHIYLLLLMVAFFIFAFQNILIRKIEHLLGKNSPSTEEEKLAARSWLEKINDFVFCLIIMTIVGFTAFFALF